ncbi:MAG TPA: ThiF family adenylyltransferase [Bryobacteraceae bacterium]|jgi:molybdopterin/thiamine biosynthesis adenylyltransferase|nr:ThiF family adenylyltransferase [Bryobacteraceae bacterium]
MTTKSPFIASQTSIWLKGTPVLGAEDRQRKIPGFDQEKFSRSHVLCIGAGGIISQIAPTLCRKGLGKITLLDDDVVEASNLNRQRFYPKDIGRYKALALAENLQAECIAATEIRGFASRFQEAVAGGIDLSCDVAVCGVDNNPARVAASSYFRALGVPVVFSAVSADADHGYVFIQEEKGPCIGCLFPDMANDDRYPCPGTPAVTDILQAVGALAVYAIDTLLMARPRQWNYRRFSLADASFDTGTRIRAAQKCQAGCSAS